MDQNAGNNDMNSQKNDGMPTSGKDSMSLSPELTDALKNVDPQHRELIVHYIQQTSLSSYSRFLPPPELLAGYEAIKGGFAERVLDLAERQADHRMECEKKIVGESANSSKRGQWFGFLLAILFLAGALALGFTGHEWLAGIIGGGTLISVVTVFLTNKPANKQVDN